jgi:hypothetical protein
VGGFAVFLTPEQLYDLTGLRLAETQSTETTWMLARSYWHDWPPAFRLTAARIMAGQTR